MSLHLADMSPGQTNGKADLRTIRWCFLGFQGRLSRQAFFLGFAFCVIASLPLVRSVLVVDGEHVRLEPGIGLFGVLLLQFAMFALAVKRLHDFDRSGFFSLVLFAPFINYLFALFLAVFPGDEGANRFGREADVPPD